MPASLLYATLRKFGLAEGDYDARPDDGLALIRARITNAVRCVPPQNRPEPGEIAACRQFLVGRDRGLAAAARLCWRWARSRMMRFWPRSALRRALFRFAHGAVHALPDGRLLADSYHCSRLNTNTGKLTAAMFEDGVRRAARSPRSLRIRARIRRGMHVAHASVAKLAAILRLLRNCGSAILRQFAFASRG